MGRITYGVVEEMIKEYGMEEKGTEVFKMEGEKF